MSEVKIDKVLVSILQKRFKSIVEEMSIAITMTTRSPILCEARDFVTGLYDAHGKMLEFYAISDEKRRAPGGDYNTGSAESDVARKWDKKADRLATQLIEARAFLAVAQRKAPAQVSSRIPR